MSAKMGIQKLISLSVLGVAMTLSGNAFAGVAGIVGSKHDFSTSGTGGNWTGEICQACHTPHNALSNAGTGATVDGPLWNHNPSTAIGTFTLYTGNYGGARTATLNAVMTQPAGTSLLCLSCHDGTVALDSFGGAQTATGVKIAGTANIGTDLSNDHPVSIPYGTGANGTGFAAAGLKDPINTVSQMYLKNGGTSTANIATDLLESFSVECSSCHDVHNANTLDSVVGGPSNYLLKVDMTNSKLCLVCHDK